MDAYEIPGALGAATAADEVDAVTGYHLIVGVTDFPVPPCGLHDPHTQDVLDDVGSALATETPKCEWPRSRAAHMNHFFQMLHGPGLQSCRALLPSVGGRRTHPAPWEGAKPAG